MTDRGIPTWDDVRRIADELELKIHLAGMDARDRWQAMQPRLAELRTKVGDSGQRASEVVQHQLAALGSSLAHLRDEIANELRGKRG